MASSSSASVCSVSIGDSYRGPSLVQADFIRPPVWACTLGRTISQPVMNTTARIGMPNTMTIKFVLCQKYGELCQPEMAMPTITKARKARPM